MTANVLSEVAGTVWKIHLKEGDVVTAGTEIAIIESMKMEILVTSPVNGTVAALSVIEGDAVAEDQLLCSISIDPT